jgi:hypothetical protein
VEESFDHIANRENRFAQDSQLFRQISTHAATDELPPSCRSVVESSEKLDTSLLPNSVISSSIAPSSQDACPDHKLSSEVEDTPSSSGSSSIK